MSLPPSVTSKKRIHLSLDKKVAVIREAENSPGTNLRNLSKRFGCGKTQIANIMKKKESILAAFESNGLCRQARVSEYRDLNESLHKWYLSACSEGSPPSGPQVIEKAKEMAIQLGKTGFKGTNGWLCKWKKRYDIHRYSHRDSSINRQTAVNQEISSSLNAVSPMTEEMVLPPLRNEAVSAPTTEDSVSSSAREEITSTAMTESSNLADILEGYGGKDIYCLDKTVCLWKALPHRDFMVRVSESASEDSEPRFMVAFLVNVEGEKEPPVVIWKEENPCCFRGLDKKSLPVKFFHHSNLWMTSDMVDELLQEFNAKMCSQNRTVLLLLDEASWCLESLEGKYSNIKLFSTPMSGVSDVLPLDQGILEFKSRYRQFLLHYVIAKINSRRCAADVAKSIDVLTAIRWVTLAWKEVDLSSISKSFVQARVFGRDTGHSEIGSFRETDNLVNMTWLISIAMGGTDYCSTEEYITGDSNLSVGERVRENHNQSSLDDQLPLLAGVKSEPRDDFSDGNREASSVGTFMEAIETLEQVREFLESCGLLEEAMGTTSLIDRLAHQHISNLTQTAIEISLNRTS